MKDCAEVFKDELLPGDQVPDAALPLLLLMVVFDVKGIKADGEDTKNNECEKLHCKT